MSFCRDCLADAPEKAARCPACGSPRLARHRELDQLTIAHVDCDAFYATIEKRDDPSLVDKPVIVGGGKRGVVAAACYVARTYGIHSAMPMFEALRRCPHAVVVTPDIAKYSKVGRDVRRAMLALTPLVEPLSIDEAFLDLTGTERLHGMSAAKVLARFAGEVERDPRLVADHPCVVPGRDLVGAFRAEFHLRPVLEHDVQRAAQDDTEMVVLAELGAGDRRDIVAPAPPGLEDVPPDHDVVELDDVDASLRERPNLVGSFEALVLESCHRRDSGTRRGGLPSARKPRGAARRTEG